MSDTAPQQAVAGGTPTWFGPRDARLFGVVHAPADGRARGGVVICPPLGREHIDTYSGLKVLAQQLCDAGFLVLRFDYLGTGDSTGRDSSAAAFDDYLDSIRTAVDYLRESGADRVAVVGLRMGALLAASAAASLAGLAGLVLWDPVTDGRRYLREQQLLYKVTTGAGESKSGAALESDPDTLAILGIALSNAATAAISAARIPGEMPVPVLMLCRPERIADRRIADLITQDNCTVAEITGQPEFIEPPSIVVKVPMHTLSAIEDWLDDTLPKDAVEVRPTTARDVAVGSLADGRPIVDSITELGPNRLFAIRTAPVDIPADGPTLLVHNTACEHRVGSGRIWTNTARELAALGMAVVRYDRRGVGDTGVATEEYAWIHAPTAIADVTDVIDAVGVAPERLMMSGICSGAWNAAYGALQYGARSLVLVNVLLYSLRRFDGAPEKLSRVAETAVGDEAVAEKRSWSLIKHGLREWLPYHGWLLLGRLGYTQAPEVLLKALAKKGIPTELVLSPSDHEWYTGHRGPRGSARLARRGWRTRLTVTPSGDHAVLDRDLQNYLRKYLADAVRRDFAGQLA